MWDLLHVMHKGSYLWYDRKNREVGDTRVSVGADE